MENLREKLLHYADDLGENVDMKKEAITSIENSVQYMSEDVLLHHSRTLAIAYLALTEEAKASKASETYGRWLDGRCTVCGWEEPDEVGYDGCELEPWEHTGYCPNCGSKMKAE